MTSEELCFMSACGIRKKINVQKLSSLEVAEVLIERIEKVEL
ncbi:MAG: hypothetical protein ACFFHV_21305 [Promethearchaeota archaeon]